MKGVTLLLVLVFLVSVVSAQENCADCGLSAAEIAAYPEPNVRQNPYNEELTHDRMYRQINGGVNVYDAPNGNIVRTFDPGSNFVTAVSEGDGWTQINPGEWVQSQHVTSLNETISRFTGVFLPEEGLPYPIAWTLINLHPSQTPGGRPSGSNPLLYRYSLVNIYATVEVAGIKWYQVGVDQWIDQRHVSKSEPIARPEGVTTEKWVAIDLFEQNVTAYEGDTPVFTTLVSTGLPRWPTPEGIYNIYWRRQREDMTWGVVGDDYYYLEEVPWTMFFDEGRALHGMFWHDQLGYTRSHGCVNMPISDAYWLYSWVAEEFDGSYRSKEREEGPQVYIFSSDTRVENAS